MSSERRCTVCNEDLPSEFGCTAMLVQLAGRDYPVKLHVGDAPCAECGAPVDGAHHSECPLERCPRCGGYLVDCGCTGKTTETKERIQWTIDEEAIASLSDADASSAIDALIGPLEEKLEALSRKAGASFDSTQVRYEIVKMILIEILRRLVLERTKGAPSPNYARSD